MHRTGGYRYEDGFGKGDGFLKATRPVAGRSLVESKNEERMWDREYRISDKGFFAGKKVLVMGLGRFGGGVDSAKFAAEAGARVTVTDLADTEQLNDSVKELEEFGDIEFHLGGHEKTDFEKADIVIVNPAVAPGDEFVRAAEQNGRFVTSQINIFFELCPATIIGITGSNGKSTAAALAAHLLRNAEGEIRDTRYENVRLSGNIGNEPLLAAIDKMGSDDLVVLEISSFQGEQLAQIEKGPKVAVLTNLTPNHLDRHGTFADYCVAKENIFKFQRWDKNGPAVSIFNSEDRIGAEWFERYRKEAGRICLKFSTDDVGEEVRQMFGLVGRANLSNLSAAIAVAKHFGVTDEQIRSSLGGFKPLAHRLELVAESKGVRWYNDSIATTPASAIAALEAFDEPKIIIAGGYDKKLSFDELGLEMAAKAKAAILIGATAKKIAEAIAKKLATEVAENTEKKVKVEIVDSLTKAVESAKNLAVSGDVVLLSPACASYDMFDNFQQRGEEFVRLVTGKKE